MKPSPTRLLFLGAALLAVRPAAQGLELHPVRPVPDGAPAAMAEITADDLRQHVEWLADDARQGRLTATAGQRATAAYIASWFEGLGLEPLGDEVDGARGWFQEWPLEQTALDPEATRVVLGERRFDTGFAVLPASASGDCSVDGRLVWCGYGAPDDLPESFAEDEIPFVMLRTRSRPDLRIEARFMIGLGVVQKAARITEKLVERGAPVVLLGMLHDDSGVPELLNYTSLAPGKPLLRFGNDAGMAAMLIQMRQDVPQVFLSAEATRVAIEAVGRTVDAEDDIAPASEGEIPAASAAVALSVVVDDVTAPNVVGLLRGSDPELAREAVVYSAHMDHVGLRLDGEVFNGADDNASGTSALLEVAQAFAAGERPKRSVIFLAVSGEELGLWGSEWFSEHPTWPLAEIVANVNIDMIGRNDADLSGAEEISVTPSYRHRKFSSIGRTAARLAQDLGLGLTIGDKFYQRSDHYNFAEKGVPVVFFCDGEHVDYHQVTDHADLLDYAKIERVARLAFWTGWEVASAESRPEELGRQPDWLPAGR